MKTLIAATSLVLAVIPALAQKTDRLPDPEFDGPKVVRTIPIAPETVHTFEQRWEPVRTLLREQAARQALETQNPPAAVPVAPAAIPRARKLAENRSGQTVCLKHGMRTVWQGSSWRCRK